MSYHQFGHFNSNINNNVSTKSGPGIAGWISSAFVRIVTCNKRTLSVHRSLLFVVLHRSSVKIIEIIPGPANYDIWYCSNRTIPIVVRTRPPRTDFLPSVHLSTVTSVNPRLHRLLHGDSTLVHILKFLMVRRPNPSMRWTVHRQNSVHSSTSKL